MRKKQAHDKKNKKVGVFRIVQVGYSGKGGPDQTPRQVLNYYRLTSHIGAGSGGLYLILPLSICKHLRK